MFILKNQTHVCGVQLRTHYHPTLTDIYLINAIINYTKRNRTCNSTVDILNIQREQVKVNNTCLYVLMKCNVK